MDRITQKDLQAVSDRINRTLGTPGDTYSQVPTLTGFRYAANIGNYHLDWAYGGVSLVRVVGASGAVSNILGRCTKRELYDQMFAFLEGVKVEGGTNA